MILVTGSDGQVGYALLKTLAPLGPVKGLTREDGDLSNAEDVAGLLEKFRPRCIVNAAAYTSVDQAESNPDAAHAMNAKLPAQLAAWARANGALLIHYSTDYVYDGSGDQPWAENALTGPLSVYGKTKLAGDQAVLDAGVDAIIFRTSWVYGARGHNFMLTMLRLARERDQLSVVSDQWGTPTPAWLIAEVTAVALRDKLRGAKALDGVYHLTCRGETTWCDFSKAIIGGACDFGVPLSMSSDKVSPIPTADYPAPAPRPLNSRLSVRRVEQALGLELPDWRDALQLTLRDWVEFRNN
ncbi:dTDP-4-dehydrorhamnose reductase [Marinobacter mobilis]|uniref:dTDP-4-dehydrorhamnose reductase n=1 Tax=Marinobacter mobilis TaxID=488533 RepID=A0A1H3DAJ2_9GAMM|nr:dTDP-4-dehydrorhamnose reductase [Marinobacter mobilis]SDX63421.1 dTDP-4-dehydrorhamnose reductase [Marinobacter mobilis]